MNSNPPKEQPNNPLHGVKLATILDVLVDKYDWDGLAKRININCFKSDPSISSSLKFLRRTAWARNKVEKLYLDTVRGKATKNPVKRINKKQDTPPKKQG